MSSTDGPEQAPRHDEPPGPTGPGHRADAPPPASVAEEAALLVELLSRRGWPRPSGMPSGAPRDRATGGSAEPGSAAGASEKPSRQDAEQPVGECTCGGTTPSACRVCPVCQLIAFVKQVNPDTIDRVADFVAFAATALHDLATAQRERQSPRDETDGTEPEGGA
ncbi:hypothetical protein [Terrabacter sp. BE26]|uniref:hypothetical protein n=1 Tax=Terrabacter sp. BE26 TaxID=2898152 RepID=UPI0035BE5237